MPLARRPAKPSIHLFCAEGRCIVPNLPVPTTKHKCSVCKKAAHGLCVDPVFGAAGQPGEEGHVAGVDCCFLCIKTKEAVSPSSAAAEASSISVFAAMPPNQINARSYPSNLSNISFLSTTASDSGATAFMIKAPKRKKSGLPILKEQHQMHADIVNGNNIIYCCSHCQKKIMLFPFTRSACIWYCSFKM